MVITDEMLRFDFPGCQLREEIPSMGRVHHGEISRACFDRKGNMLFQLAWMGIAEDPRHKIITWIRGPEYSEKIFSPPETYHKYKHPDGIIVFEHPVAGQRIIFYPKSIKEVSASQLVTII